MLSSSGRSPYMCTQVYIWECICTPPDHVGSSIWNFLQTVTAVADDMVSGTSLVRPKLGLLHVDAWHDDSVGSDRHAKKIYRARVCFF